MLSPDEIRDTCQAGKGHDPAWYRIHRRLSIHLSAWLLSMPVRPMHVSALMLSLGFLGALACAHPHLAVNALGWACLYAAFLLDRVDGEIARFRREESVIGILLDRFHHRLIEPLLFLGLGLRASRATGSALPLVGALAAMLAANVVEETQQLPAFIAAKFARETRRWPAAGRRPPVWLERAAEWMRPLKTFRTFITLLPLAIAAALLEAVTGRPVVTWLLLTSALALWTYAIFQACYYALGRLETEIDALTRQLPALSCRDEEVPPARAPAPVATEATPAPDAARALETVPRAAGTAWPLPARSSRPQATAAADPIAPRHGAAHAGAVSLVLLAMLLALSGSASAATYYVDGSSLQCSNAGPGTEAQPYCTISAAIAARGTAGNTILVKPGTYREIVTFPASGTSAAPIVLRASGPGVVLDGADDFSSPAKWTAYTSDVWVATSVNWNPGQVFADGVR